MPDKEQFRKQVQVGVDYAVESELDEEQMVAHLTDHLWGTVGMWLQDVQYKVGYRGVDEIDGHEVEVEV